MQKTARLIFHSFLGRSEVDFRPFSTSFTRYLTWSCQKVYDALHYPLDDISIRFSSKLYRRIICIPMYTNCAPLGPKLFLFCYERDFIKSPSSNIQADFVEAFSSNLMYLNDLLNINNPYGKSDISHRTSVKLNKFL